MKTWRFCTDKGDWRGFRTERSRDLRHFGGAVGGRQELSHRLRHRTYLDRARLGQGDKRHHAVCCSCKWPWSPAASLWRLSDDCGGWHQRQFPGFGQGIFVTDFAQQIWNSEHHRTLFLQNLYEFVISVDSEPGQLVGKINAWDPDSSDQDKLKFSIRQTDTKSILTIDPKTGMFLQLTAAHSS